MARNLISVSSVVNDYLLTQEESDYGKGANKIQLMTYARQFVRNELPDATKKVIKSVQLDVDQTNYTVAFPNDYIEYTKIGVLDRNCQVQVMSLNQKLNFSGTITLSEGVPVVDSDGIEVLTDTECTPADSGSQVNPYGVLGYFFNNYMPAQGNGRLFGLGGGQSAWGEYRVDTMNNRLELNSQFGNDKIILEYMADESMASDPMVPVQAEGWLRQYLYFRSIQFKRGIPQSAIAEAERRVGKEKRKTNFRSKMFTKAEAVQQINRRFQLSPKFATD